MEDKTGPHWDNTANEEVPGVTEPKLFSPTSVAGYAGPSFFLTDQSRVPGTMMNSVFIKTLEQRGTAIRVS